MTTTLEQPTTGSAVVPSAPGINPSSDAIISIRNLRKWYQVGGGFLGFGKKIYLKAVDDVSFDIEHGKTFGLVGESGCGKTTTLKVLLGLEVPTAGQIFYEGEDVSTMTKVGKTEFRRSVQAVFQDPWSSLNPRMTVGAIIAEPLRNFGLGSRADQARRVAELIDRVGLPKNAAERYPYEFSGGQRQRIGIARALAPEPRVIVCDESVSALDVSVQAQVINLLMDLQAEFAISYLFIAHDLAVVEHISHRVAVMYLGQIVELADKAALYARPQHPYTKALMSAVPRPEPGRKRDRIVLEGDLPSPLNPPAGCRFHTRCPHAFHRCRTEVPQMRELTPGHVASCHLLEPSGPTFEV